MFDSVDRSAAGLLNESQATTLIKKLSSGLTTVKIQQKLTVNTPDGRLSIPLISVPVFTITGDALYCTEWLSIGNRCEQRIKQGPRHALRVRVIIQGGGHSP